MSLLPSTDSEPDADQSGPLRVLDVDDEAADAVFEALAAETTRAILAEVHRDPGTPSALADRADTTVQNAVYHLEKLEDAGLVRVADEEYSSRGRTMQVYAPSENPFVVFVGTDDRKDGLFATLKRLLGAIGVLALAGALVRPAASVALSLLEGFDPGDPSAHRRALAAVAGAAALVASTASLRESTRGRRSGVPVLTRSMHRKTLFTVVALVLCAGATPVALAHSPAVSGEYLTSTAPASLHESPADAPVPDLSGESVAFAVTGGDHLRDRVADSIAADLRDRGASVDRQSAVDDAASHLFVVDVAEGGVDADRFTPSANVTLRFAYVESGNATVASDALAATERDAIGPYLVDLNASQRVRVGEFRYTRGDASLALPLNTIDRYGATGASADEYRDDVAAAVADQSVAQAFDEDPWG